MIGADVEVPLKGKQGFVSAIDLIGGSKAKPFIVDGGNLQEDNVLAEFAIDPAKDKKDFRDKIIGVYGILEAKMKEYDLEIEIHSSVTYDDDQLSHPMAKEFGCDPDMSAYMMHENTPPDPEKVGNLRSCGGHVHVSFPEIEEGINEKAEFIRILDLVLGVPSVVMDTDTDRRKLYGKAGSFRAKTYGVEYRTLSNFWIQSTSHIDWVYDQVEKAKEMFLSGYRITLDVGTKAIKCIDKGDTELAQELIDEHDLEVV